MTNKQLEILYTLDNALNDLEQNIELTKYLSHIVTDLHLFAQLNLSAHCIENGISALKVINIGKR